MAQQQQRLELTRSPVKITNGQNYAFLQSANGREFSVAVGDTAPTVNGAWQTVRELSVAPPFIIWACSMSETSIPVNISVASY